VAGDCGNARTEAQRTVISEGEPGEAAENEKSEDL